MSDSQGRRTFLRNATQALAAAGLAPLATEAGAQAAAKPNAGQAVSFPPIDAPTEAEGKVPGPFEAPDRRVGYAVVGLGRLTLEQILPAMGTSKYCKVTALVSGDPAKARKVAAQYGIPASGLYDYTTYDQIAKNPAVQAVYIVLPNSMHAEYTIRGAKAGKHVLCEKPMATSAADCERMIAACKAANVKLMIAYRSQYEPNDLALIDMIAAGKLGTLRQMVATNSQNMGDPTQWRLNRKLAGGGALPDIGLYCLNAARFLSKEEPYEVLATTWQPKDDPRFKEVEAAVQVIARFPSGFTAVFNSSYAAHKSQTLRLEGSDAWAELNPAFAYHGVKLRVSKLLDGKPVVIEPMVTEKDQFAAEMDHFAECVQGNLEPHTPGEEGLQDQRIMDAIYESARTGKAVKLTQPAGPVRGPAPRKDE